MRHSYFFSPRNLLILLTLAATRLPALAQAPAVQWDRGFGGSADDQLSVVSQTADGGYLLGGSSQSGATGDKTQASLGNFDYWVVKLDAGGTKVWDKTLGGNGEDRLTCMQQTADGGYILGGTSASGLSGSKSQTSRGGVDFWVVKLDAAGTKLWDKTLGGGTNDRLNSIQQTADGGYIVGGPSDSGISGEKSQATQGSFDYWVVKLDAAGAKVWDKTLGGSSNDILNGVLQATDGGYVLGGFSYSGVSGDKSQPNSPGPEYDYWVVKLDAAGAKVWDKTFGGTGPDNLTSIQQTTDGGYIAGGFSDSPVSPTKSQASRGGFDNWIVKISPTGAEEWDKTFGGGDYDQLNSLQQTADRGYLLGGFSYSAPGGDRTGIIQGAPGTADFWVLKTDSMGVKQWDQSFGGAQEDKLNSLRQTADGGFILGGVSNSGISGTKTQAGRGNYDYWVVKLGPATPSGINGAQARAAFNLYPNPTQGAFSVQLPAQWPRTQLRLRLYDATGRLVRALQPETGPAGVLQVNTGAQPAGLYLLRLDGPGGFSGTQRLQLK